MKFTIEVTRTVTCQVEVEAPSAEEALRQVDLVSFQLPDPDQWSANKDSYEYQVVS